MTKAWRSKSPTVRLLIGLLVTLAAVTGFSWYSLYELRGLRELQTNTIDVNRHDSLLLARVQNDLNMLGTKLRDMADTQRTSSIAAYRGEFARLRTDLRQALHDEAKLAPVMRRASEQAQLNDALNNFWYTSDRVFAAATSGHERAARRLASTQLSAEQSLIATRVSQLIDRNNRTEEKADAKIAAIYDGAEQDIYAFMIATLVAIVGTSLYLIYSNREIFDKLQSLSRQRRVLAARLINLQEEVLRSVSRELHDEFGQILTAVGTMLARAERKGVPADSPLRTELSEVREITNKTLEKIRSLSQMLHPAVIDDYGLAKAIEWYAEVFQRQTGIQTNATILGEPVRITGQPAIHCFRIVQEALNNIAKHSGSKTADVEVIFSKETLSVHVRDFGRGMPQVKKMSKPGLGLIAMRERAELVSGTLNISSAPNAGTTVSLEMPLRVNESISDSVDVNEEMEEVVSREL